MIEPGTELGSFVVAELLGKGGMGEVYRARDTKLGRDVAIKVLPERLSRDVELLGRFEREAQALASLNHPNVATVHGFERDAARGILFLVMELISGQSLGEYCGGKALSAERALPLFVQMAEGLDAAHESGIVHRDLKPENVRINDDGVLKILDFGLAKVEVGSPALDPDAPTTPASPVAMTVEGAFMGTPMYVSPEQARGRGVDKRTDIWAFGCCLYEVLTGTMPFRGDTVADTLSQVLEREPDWGKLPDDLPWRLEELVRNCLEKNVRERVRDIGDVARELRAMHSDSGRITEVASVPAVGQPGRRIPVWLSVLAGLVSGALAVWVGVMLTGDRVDAPESDIGSLVSPESYVFSGPEKRFEIIVGTTAQIGFDPVQARPIISRDGERIAYTANLDGVGRLYVRELNSLEVTVIPDSVGARYAGFSPDGKSVGFLREDEESQAIYVASVESLKVDKVCDIPKGWGFCWLDNGTMLYSSPAEGLSQGVLYKVSLSDREPVAVTVVTEDGDELYHMYPTAIPDSNLALFQITYPDETESPLDNRRSVGIFDTDSGEHAVVVENADYGVFGGGHIVFTRGIELWAVPFDVDSGVVTGPERRLYLEGNASVLWANRAYSLSRDGAIVFQPELEVYEPEREMVFVSGDGLEQAIAAPSGRLTVPRMTRDGSQIAVNVGDFNDSDIYIHTVANPGSFRRSTFFDGTDTGIAWEPDGQRFSFSSSREGNLSIFEKGSDGLGEVDEVLSLWRAVSPIDIDSTGRFMTFAQIGEVWSIGLLNRDRGTSETIIESHSNNLDGQISPDGEWLVYASDNSGQFEVFVRPFPNVAAGTFQVSRDGGFQPMWSVDGSEIFFRKGDAMMAVAVDTTNGFEASQEVVLFEGSYYDNPFNVREYDLEYPDGERFLMVREVGIVPTTRLIYVENWLETED